MFVDEKPAVPYGEHAALQFTLAHVAAGLLTQLLAMRSLNRRADGQLIFEVQKAQLANVLVTVSGLDYRNKLDKSVRELVDSRVLPDSWEKTVDKYLMAQPVIGRKKAA